MLNLDTDETSRDRGKPYFPKVAIATRAVERLAMYLT
jgi:hypothetical protein